MYSFFGLYHRIWCVSGQIVFWIMVCVLLSRPKKFSIKKHWEGLLAIGFAIAYALFMLSRIYFPDIESYTGKFLYCYNNSRIYSNNTTYVFENGREKDQTFDLDGASKRKIFPDEFEKGKTYTVYYDTLTDIIVGVKE